MPFQSKVRNQVLSGQAREIVNSVLEFMQKEADANQPILDIRKVRERVSLATGVSMSTIKRIKREASQIKAGLNASFSTPNEIRKERRSPIALDELGRSELRNIIENFQKTEKEMPSLPRIYAKMWEECGYVGSSESLRKEIHGLGYQFRRKLKGGKYGAMLPKRLRKNLTEKMMTEEMQSETLKEEPDDPENIILEEDEEIPTETIVFVKEETITEEPDLMPVAAGEEGLWDAALPTNC